MKKTTEKCEKSFDGEVYLQNLVRTDMLILHSISRELLITFHMIERLREREAGNFLVG